MMKFISIKSKSEINKVETNTNIYEELALYKALGC